MTTDTNRLRSEYLNTQVITRNAGKRLGVVKDLLVDIDRREVVALGLRDNLLSISGMPKYMMLDSIQRSGDVILVEDEDVIEDVEVDLYSRMINLEVMTETGELLGRVRDFQFNIEEGTVSSLIIASFGLPQIPEQVLSTYELPVDEIISSGPDRIIVFEGAEERLVQLTVGVLERLGISSAPWDREEEDGFSSATVRPENQLPTGIPVNAEPARPLEARAPVEDRWSDDDWEEVPVRPVTPPRRQQEESIRYNEYEEEDNWSDERPATRYESRAYIDSPPPESQAKEEYEDDLKGDVWDDDVKPEPYRPPKVNIPEKAKIPEYEEETNY